MGRHRGLEPTAKRPSDGSRGPERADARPHLPDGRVVLPRARCGTLGLGGRSLVLRRGQEGLCPRTLPSGDDLRGRSREVEHQIGPVVLPCSRAGGCGRSDTSRRHVLSREGRRQIPGEDGVLVQNGCGRGDPSGESPLARMYREGIGVERDDAEAARWQPPADVSD